MLVLNIMDTSGDHGSSKTLRRRRRVRAAEGHIPQSHLEVDDIIRIDFRDPDSGEPDLEPQSEICLD